MEINQNTLQKLEGELSKRSKRVRTLNGLLKKWEEMFAEDNESNITFYKRKDSYNLQIYGKNEYNKEILELALNESTEDYMEIIITHVKTINFENEEEIELNSELLQIMHVMISLLIQKINNSDKKYINVLIDKQLCKLLNEKNSIFLSTNYIETEQSWRQNSYLIFNDEKEYILYEKLWSTYKNINKLNTQDLDVYNKKDLFPHQILSQAMALNIVYIKMYYLKAI